ncbi:Z-ring formation inhibitor MciZ [Cohnella pontilimi]|uniref:Z-ring formation inhibitor MciZ n=1 Tax=Cohnella pontilimi TaxID=2564100 RepID=A0A4U0FHI2_9BACL|nr:Z-ring formation inhibitor MciZ [Cohnella pontilimi]TJY44417.1 Z-ring formation inhibitor MciZ [Cohnella pontilimi]
MLKRYEARDHIRWVGKAWEIRRALRQEMKRRGANARVTDIAAARAKQGK